MNLMIANKLLFQLIKKVLSKILKRLRGTEKHMSKPEPKIDIKKECVDSIKNDFGNGIYFLDRHNQTPVIASVIPAVQKLK